jgi:hypothetical protein
MTTWAIDFRRLTCAGLAFCAGCVLTLAILSIVATHAPPRENNNLSLPLIAECISGSTMLTGQPSVALVKDVQSLCYDQIYGQGLLNDFQLRRLAFVEQAYSERVILWMVVLITLSGVLLAGLQVLASYKLAAAGRGQMESSEINLARDKLSLKSSITGLFILIISFAFFYVFVFEVYKIHPIDPDGKNASQPAYVGQMTTPTSETSPTTPK